MNTNTDTTRDTESLGNTINQTRNTRSRHWLIVINNYTSSDVEFLKSLQDCKVTFQLEKGKCGTPHIQGGISFENARYFNAVKKMFPTAHIEAARSIQAVIQYSLKDSTRDGEQFSTHEVPTKKPRITYDTIYERILLENPYFDRHEIGFHTISGWFLPPVDAPTRP